MSKSAHAKSSYKLRKLPRCPRCDIEFVLVLSAYEKMKPGTFVWEWECSKCKKIVSRDALREEKPDEQDIWLNKWCEKERIRCLKVQKRVTARQSPV